MRRGETLKHGDRRKCAPGGTCKGFRRRACHRADPRRVSALRGLGPCIGRFYLSRILIDVLVRAVPGAFLISSTPLSFFPLFFSRMSLPFFVSLSLTVAV